MTATAANPPALPAVRAGRRARTGALLVAAALAAIIAHVVHPDGPIGELSYLSVNVGATAAAWAAMRRSLYPGIAAHFAAGITLAAIGDTVFQVWDWTQPAAPDVSIADLAWLGSYIALIAGVVRILRSGDRRIDLAAWTDIGTFFVIALTVQWGLGLGDAVHASGPVLVRVVWIAYPVLDALVLALLGRALGDGAIRGPAGILLVLGIVLWLLPDAVIAISANESLAAILEAGWIGGSVALASAIWWSRRPLSSAEPTNMIALERVGTGQLVIGMAMLLVPSLIEVVSYFAGSDPNPVPLFLVMLTLVTMMGIRSVMMVAQSRTDRDALDALERRASRLAENSSDAVTVVDGGGTVIDDGSQLAALLGFHGVARGIDVFSRVLSEDLDAAHSHFERALRSPGVPVECEVRGICRKGAIMWLGVRITNLLDDPDVRGVVMNIHDVTDRKRAEAQLSHQAFHDGLTGLPNRALFADRVEHSLQRANRSGEGTAVVFLDLDGFKNVNDSLGHAAGDSLLCTVASRLSGAVRSGETIARLGGDEFAVLIEPGPHPIEDAQVVAERILQALGDPIELGDHVVSVSASIGIAGADSTADAGSLLRDADVAMYKAKTAGKAQWVVFDAAMRTAAVERLALESDLAHALERGELALVYQPVINLESNLVVGFEALIRWHHPSLGLVGPDRFIPMAEENGLIVPIGAWVIQEACRTASRWQRRYPLERPLTMAVNVSARQLACETLVDQVAAALASSGVDPSTLVVEMTETSLVRDAAAAAQQLHRLRELGVRLAIDDFGTGYSSLSYLRQFPVDILKIDRSFVSSITSREAIPAIVRGLLDLGRTLELEMVAEGVEEEVQRDCLRDESCALAQGYLFARPLESADAELLLIGLVQGAGAPPVAQA